MGDVVYLERGKDAPHLSGKARCLACRYEWVAVCPVGTHVLECPECACDGHMLGEVEYESRHWRCDCGWFLFKISAMHGAYCPNCGLTQRW